MLLLEHMDIGHGGCSFFVFGVGGHPTKFLDNSFESNINRVKNLPLDDSNQNYRVDLGL